MQVLKNPFASVSALVLLVVAVAFGQDGQADALGPGSVRVVVPAIASDGVDPGANELCRGDAYAFLVRPGALRQRAPLEFGDPPAVVVPFEFTNPCDAPIAPARLHVVLSTSTTDIDLTMGAIPSLVGAGGTGYYLAILAEGSYPGTDELFDVSAPPEDIPATWEELEALARGLTVDAKGNDAISPDFDLEYVVQFDLNGDLTIRAKVEGNPPAWPPYLWLHGACEDGSTGIGHFSPDEYGYNPGGATAFKGYSSWLGCRPTKPLVLGPDIDAFWLEAAAGGQPNTIFLDDVSLEQTTAATFRLAANVINTNFVAGRPTNYNFDLARAAGPPFRFSVPGSDPWFPGIQGSIVINSIPGDVDDFTSIAATVTGTVAAPGLPVPAFSLPPTFLSRFGAVRDPYANMVLVPNHDRLGDYFAADAEFAWRAWLQRDDRLSFLKTAAKLPLDELPDAFFVRLGDDDVDIESLLAEAEASISITFSVSQE